MITNYTEKLKQYINENEQISTFDLVEIMGAHTSFLILLLILSVLNIILAPLPINSFILGVPLIFFSICYLFGCQRIMFSKKLLKKSENVKRFGTIPNVSKLQKPRNSCEHFAKTSRNSHECRR